MIHETAKGAYLNNVGTYVPLRGGMPADGLDALYLMMDGVSGQSYGSTIRDWSGKGNHAILRSGYTAAKQGVDGLECAPQHGSVYISPLVVKRRQTTLVVGAAHPDAAALASGVGDLGVNFSSFTKGSGVVWDNDPTNHNPTAPYPYLSQFKQLSSPTANRSAVNAFLNSAVSGENANVNAGDYYVGSTFAVAFAVDMETGLIRANGLRPPSMPEATRTGLADRMALDGYDVGNHQIGSYPNSSNYRPVTSYFGKVYLHAIYDYVMTASEMASAIARAMAIVSARGVIFS